MLGRKVGIEELSIGRALRLDDAPLVGFKGVPESPIVAGMLVSDRDQAGRISLCHDSRCLGALCYGGGANTGEYHSGAGGQPAIGCETLRDS